MTDRIPMRFVHPLVFKNDRVFDAIVPVSCFEALINNAVSGVETLLVGRMVAIAPRDFPGRGDNDRSNYTEHRGIPDFDSLVSAGCHPCPTIGGLDVRDSSDHIRVDKRRFIEKSNAYESHTYRSNVSVRCNNTLFPGGTDPNIDTGNQIGFAEALMTDQQDWICVKPRIKPPDPDFLDQWAEEQPPVGDLPQKVRYGGDELSEFINLN